MFITTTDTTPKVIRKAVLLDAAPIPPKATYFSTPIRPYEIEIEYVWDLQLGWYVGGYQVRVQARKVKKDGSDSEVVVNDVRPLTELDPTTKAKRYRREWAWVQSVVDLLRPTGSVRGMSARDVLVAESEGYLR